MDESSAGQQVYVSASITFVVRKNWAYPPSDSGSYRREGGREGDKIWVDFKSFKILELYNVFLEKWGRGINKAFPMHFSCFSSGKAYYKVCFEVLKNWTPLFFMSIPTIKVLTYLMIRQF